MNPPAACTCNSKRKHSDKCLCDKCRAGEDTVHRTPQRVCDYCIINKFDLDSYYGPKSGITRQQRLERSQAFGFQVDPITTKTIEAYRDYVYPF